MSRRSCLHESRLDADRHETLLSKFVIEGLQIVAEPSLAGTVDPDGLSTSVSCHRGEDTQRASPAHQQSLTHLLAERDRVREVDPKQPKGELYDWGRGGSHKVEQG